MKPGKAGEENTSRYDDKAKRVRVKSPARLIKFLSGYVTAGFLFVVLASCSGKIAARFLLRVNVNGEGTVTSTPAGISCPADCSESYDSGTPVTLAANPASGWRFDGWTGNPDCSDGRLVVDTDKDCGATFSPIPPQEYTLTVTVIGQGTVASNPPGISCPESCSHRFPEGTRVSLTTISESGWKFNTWSGNADCGTGNVVVDSDKSCIAEFVPGRRTITFSGYEWYVKTSGTRKWGPGPNHFSDSTENVWVDEQGQLHLRITYRNGKWYCAEVYSTRSFGYGKYIFYLTSRIDLLDKNAVVGLFTWDDADENNRREIDIEFAKWGVDNHPNSQYVVQPWDTPGNLHSFQTELNGSYSTHSFDWSPVRVFFQSLHGHSRAPPENSYIIEEWDYTGSSIPQPGSENVRINLWLFQGFAPSDGKEIEITVKGFEFIPPMSPRP